MRRQDLTGQRFGRLVVLKFSHTNNIGKTCDLCRCDCGKKLTVCRGSLVSSNTKSCGCALRELYTQNSKDPTGKKFGRLTVLGFSHLNNYKSAYYLCVCDCGEKVLVRNASLRSGKTKSCGCLRTEVISKWRSRKIIGERFGRLLVLKQREDLVRKAGHVQWECLCRCGKISIYSTNNLISGNTKSCGCYSSDISRMLMQSSDFRRISLMKRQQQNLGL